MGPHRKCKQQSCFCLMHSFVFELQKNTKKTRGSCFVFSLQHFFPVIINFKQVTPSKLLHFFTQPRLALCFFEHDFAFVFLRYL